MESAIGGRQASWPDADVAAVFSGNDAGPIDGGRTSTSEQWRSDAHPGATEQLDI
jgi:hypothetical protein